MSLQIFVVISLAALFCFSEALLGIGRTQTIDVQGSLTCDGQPSSGVLVKLYDSNTFQWDNLLGKANTNSAGQFSITGKINDITKMDPKVNIYTNCHVGAVRCPRKIVLKVPHSAINSGNTYSIGHIELANKYPGESHDCIH
uniref:Transthyretin-like family protein n=1 Tax=Acrobeloides nanus TaxID=290746 RepID=A0A914DBC9_9BILA